MPNRGGRVQNFDNLVNCGTLEQVAADTGLVNFLPEHAGTTDKVSISVDNSWRNWQHYYQIHMVHFFNAPEENQ